MAYTQSTSSFFSPAYLVKMDTLGNILWTRAVSPLSAEFKTVEDILPTADGGVYVGGWGMFTCDIIGIFAYIMKFDKTGEVVWTRTWGENSSYDYWEGSATGFSHTASGKLVLQLNHYPHPIIFTTDENGVARLIL